MLVALFINLVTSCSKFLVIGIIVFSENNYYLLHAFSCKTKSQSTSLEASWFVQNIKLLLYFALLLRCWLVPSYGVAGVAVCAVIRGRRCSCLSYSSIVPCLLCLKCSIPVCCCSNAEHTYMQTNYLMGMLYDLPSSAS